MVSPVQRSVQARQSVSCHGQEQLLELLVVYLWWRVMLLFWMSRLIVFLFGWDIELAAVTAMCHLLLHGSIMVVTNPNLLDSDVFQTGTYATALQ